MAITQRQIAEQANVSRSTVAAILANRRAERFSEEVRERVLQIAANSGYRPNRYARIISNGQSGTIGILSFGGGRAIPAQKVKAATDAIQQAGYEPLVHDVTWYGNDVTASCELLLVKMLDAKVEGLLVVHPSVKFLPEYLSPFAEAEIPVVSIGGEHLAPTGVPLVLSDRVWGYQRLTEHLLTLGYRRLALLRASAPAELGFLAALRAHPETLEPPIILSPREEISIAPGEAPERFSGRLGYHGMQRLLAMTPRPEAVLCTTDVWAFGALRACAEAGVRVPHDIAITGFENVPESEYGSVPLTTIDHPSAEIALQAVGKLLPLIRRESPRGGSIPIKGTLIIRNSCGASL